MGCSRTDIQAVCHSVHAVITSLASGVSLRTQRPRLSHDEVFQYLNCHGAPTFRGVGGRREIATPSGSWWPRVGGGGPGPTPSQGPGPSPCKLGAVYPRAEEVLRGTWGATPALCGPAPKERGGRASRQGSIPAADPLRSFSEQCASKRTTYPPPAEWLHCRASTVLPLQAAEMQDVECKSSAHTPYSVLTQVVYSKYSVSPAPGFLRSFGFQQWSDPEHEPVAAPGADVWGNKSRLISLVPGF
jgi:hypothetical protein